MLIIIILKPCAMLFKETLGPKCATVHNAIIKSTSHHNRRITQSVNSVSNLEFPCPLDIMWPKGAFPLYKFSYG